MDVLDNSYKNIEKDSKYSKWSLRLLVYSTALSLIVFFKIINFTGFSITNFGNTILILTSLIIDILFLLGIVFIIIGLIRKEKMGAIFITSIIGHAMFIGVTLYYLSTRMQYLI